MALRSLIKLSVPHPIPPSHQKLECHPDDLIWLIFRARRQLGVCLTVLLAPASSKSHQQILRASNILKFKKNLKATQQYFESLTGQEVLCQIYNTLHLLFLQHYDQGDITTDIITAHATYSKLLIDFSQRYPAPHCGRMLEWALRFAKFQWQTASTTELQFIITNLTYYFSDSSKNETSPH